MSELYIQPRFEADRLALARRLLAGVRASGAFIDIDEATEAIAAAAEHGRRIGVARMVGESFCRVCGCSRLAPCRTPEPCAWVTSARGVGLCTACAPFVEGYRP